MGKSRVLVVGGTGYLGKRIVEASLKQGHETYVLQRPENGLDIDKVQMLLSFKKKGARLVEGSFSNHESLVDAVKLVDVVICTMSGVHIRSHNILLQLKLIDAIKEAGNVKRFLPSEFGMDVTRMHGKILQARKVTFDDKMVVRRAVEDANIPFTYISANLCAGYFALNLSQLGPFFPPKQDIHLFGDGNVKAIYLDEDDVATYTIKTIDDPRTLNKTVYLRPPENIMSQRELIQVWENITGKQLNKHTMSEDEFLRIMKGMDPMRQIGLARKYHIFYEGCLTNFEVMDDEEASKLYPEVEYTRMADYFKRYV
ncbi:hypothetical protein Ancab_015854 [Ancistrocladus abbreviatus]